MKKEINHLNRLITILLKSSVWSLVDYTHNMEVWIDAINLTTNKMDI